MTLSELKHQCVVQGMSQREIDLVVQGWDAALREVYAKGRKDAEQDGWVKCSERLPEGEGRYLIRYTQHNQTRTFVGDFYAPSQEWDCSVSGMAVTHWRPLPVPPEEK